MITTPSPTVTHEAISYDALPAESERNEMRAHRHSRTVAAAVAVLLVAVFCLVLSGCGRAPYAGLWQTPLGIPI
jgi:hypothetical protein